MMEATAQFLPLTHRPDVVLPAENGLYFYVPCVTEHFSKQVAGGLPSLVIFVL